ncbi:MAG: hypothetical protein WDN04_26630 [Rhodospirillales bacterium]
MDTPWPRHDPDPVVQRRQRIALFLVMSVLIHVAVLLVQFPQRFDMGAPTGQAFHQERLTVRLAQPSAPAPKAVAEPEPQPTPRRPPRPTPPRTPVLAVPTPSPQSPRVAVQPAPQPDYARPMDMMAMVNMARARRAAADAAAARENAEASGLQNEPSADEIAQANLNRNLQTLNNARAGTSGIFTILNKGTRTAQFSFNGWTPGVGNKFHQVIEVDAGNLGDVDLAIVRRMIEVIRSHYSGDFNWDSHRLGKVVVMSARPQDQAELEQFMLKEFPEFRRGR